MAAHVAHLVDLLEELFDVEFFEELDADAEFGQAADGGGQRAAGEEASAVGREFGAVDPVAEDNAVEQLSEDRHVGAEWFEQRPQPDVSRRDVADFTPDEKLEVVSPHL